MNMKGKSSDNVSVGFRANIGSNGMETHSFGMGMRLRGGALGVLATLPFFPARGSFFDFFF